MRRPHHGGRNARDWRRKIAALARRKRENVFTYKFGLETKAGDIDFAAAARAYDIVEGTAKGSLIGLVCAVHLSGFRLFSKGGETLQFRERSRYPAKAFADALRTHSDIENPGVTIQSIENVFASPPRKRGAVAPEWSPDALARRLFQAWNGRSPRDSDRDRPMRRLANGIAREASRKFNGWREIADDMPGALTCADRYLASLGDSFPNLGDLPPGGADIAPPNATFAYDSESPFVEMGDEEEIWPHQVVAICAGRLQRDAPDMDISSSSFTTNLKNLIVTRTNNGLQWLFGNGLRYLRETDIERIAGDSSVPPSEIRRARQLKAFADAIPLNPLFDADGYAEFRLSVGGKITSWVSNYWKRVRELAALHSKPMDISIPAKLYDAEHKALFSGQHTGAAGLDALSARIPKRIDESGSALAILSGDGVPGPEAITSVERAAGDVAELAGQLAMLDNRITQEIDRSRAEDAGRVNTLETLRRSLPGKLKKPPKLNRISGGAADADGEIRRLQDDLNAAVRGRREHFHRLAQWAGDLDPLPAMAERERKALEDRGRDANLADEQATRRLLHRIVGMSRRLSGTAAAAVRDAVAPLFRDKKETNRYFHNRKGAIYRHPFSASRHQAYDLDIASARETDWLAWLEARKEDIRAQLAGNGEPALFRDLLAIEGFIFTNRLGGLPDLVPGELAKPRGESGPVSVPPLLAAQLNAEEVSRDVALRAFSLFNSAINGLSFRAFRESFIVRVKFLRADRDELFYAPKNKAWRAPCGYPSAKGEIAQGLALSAVARDEAGAVLARETAERLSKAKFPEPGSRALLRQAPHDWFIELDFRGGEAPKRAGLPVKKNADGLKRWRPLRRPAFRLIGPPSFKTWLDLAMTRKDVMLGDYTLIFDQRFKQSLTLEGEEIRLAAKPVGIRAEAAVPVIDKRPHPKETGDLLFNNIVAIDLGEKRVGFAVFSLIELLEKNRRDPVVGDEGKPVVGTVAVPAFRRLMAAVRRHRGSRQPNQKVGQTYSKALMRFRENVVGDVCNRIDTLCERFRAFPVLESSIGNFETGGNQLKLIYGSVLRRYAFSEVEAHRTARRHYWFTADTWGHPYLHAYEWSEKSKAYSGPSKPLNLFPGVKVNPAGTSQTCHSCGRNALSALRGMPERIEAEEGGRIVLGDGAIRLLERADYSPDEMKRLRRRKERPAPNTPVRKGTHTLRNLERILRRNMRQAPLSEMSPDTSQARFVCVYEDCGFSGHADENAAINIGRRFLDRIDVQASAARRAELTSASG